MNASLFAEFMKKSLAGLLQQSGQEIINAEPKDQLNLHRLHGQKAAVQSILEWVDKGLQTFLNSRSDGGTTLIAPTQSDNQNGV